MAKYFEGGSWVWVPDEKHVVLAGKVRDAFRMGEAGKVVLEDGTTRSLTAEESKGCHACDPSTLSGDVDNLTTLDDLNESSLLNILRTRFKKDRIYSNIGTILVSINPFKPLALYTPQAMEEYKEGPRGRPPHVFAIGHNAYYDMLNERKNQSVIITGESGAGKSEACKLVLQFIADLSAAHSGKTSAASDDDASLEQQLLQANPILEAFGNAKTVRNNNSSRFGKLITIKFDRMGAICEGSIISYLLEKSRVVRQMQNERNYHIFYQLVAASEEDRELQRSLHLDAPDAFAYLNKSGVVRIDGVVDEADFDEVRNAMDTLRFHSDEKQEIWKTLAAVLHLGNLVFSDRNNPPEDAPASVRNGDVLAIAAGLLSVDTQALAQCLTTRKLSVGNVIVPYKVNEANNTRDAMSKTLYAFMFEWIIARINTTLEQHEAAASGGKSAGRTKEHVIGVLDIFGFESFVTNSFEQLCINYCNEKLNNHFNEHVFKLELAAYAEEGVVVPSLEFKDNKSVLDFLEVKANGIFAILDEQIMVNGNDDKFLSKLQQTHQKNPHHILPKRSSCPDPDSRNCFGVQHYAGDVFYNVKDFTEKNKDALHPDVVETLQDSSSEFVRAIFDQGMNAGGGKAPSTAGTSSPTRTVSTHRRDSAAAGGGKGGGGEKPAKGSGMAQRNTLGKQFKAQLDTLMTTLNATDPHFIRCMKPNSEKTGDLFTAPMMLEQLRYSGLLEVCTIRKMGFPIRRPFVEFFNRYKCVCPGARDLDGLLADLQAAGKLSAAKFAKGKRRILMKNDQASDLDLYREKELERHIAQIQRLARGFVVRRRLRFFRTVLKALREAIAVRSEEKLAHWLTQASELPGGGAHIAVVAEAESLLRRLEQEGKVLALLEEAMQKRDLNGIATAIATAHKMAPPLKHPRIADAEALRVVLEEEKALLAKLRAAVAKKDLGALAQLLREAEAKGVDGEEVKQARALKQRIEEEDSLRRALAAATAARSLSQLNELVNKATAMGLGGAELDAARAAQKELVAAGSALKALALATESKNLDGIVAAMAKLQQMGIKDAAEMKVAVPVRQRLEAEAASVAKLQAAIEAHDLKALTAAVAAAEKLGLTGEATPEMADALSMRDALQGKVKGDAANMVQALRQAMRGNDAEALSAAIGRCAGSADLQADPAAVADLDAAKRRQKQLAAQQKARAALELALRTKSLDRVGEAIAAAEACEYAGPELDAARGAAEQLTHRQEVFAAVQTAMGAKDMGALGKAIAEAERLNVDKELQDFAELQEVKASMTRADRVAEVKALLRAGVEADDLARVNKAIAMAIELGCEGDPDVAAAAGAQRQLSVVEDLRSKVAAATRVLGVKVGNKSGITAADLEPLAEAVAEAAAAGVPPAAPFLAEAVGTLQRCERQLEAQAMLTQALASLSKEKMREALEAAEELELQLEMMTRVRRALRRVEDQRDEGPMDGGLSTMTEGDIERFRAERDERHARAANPKYKFANFPRLRSPADYAKGNLLHKKREMERMLEWQNTAATKSLLDLDKEVCKEAITVRKSLLGYMGDKQMSFPETLAQNILMKGLDKAALRDEIYLQIMKQLTCNPKPDSTAKGWQVMCMCCSTFLPSADFENYLLNFILDKGQNEGAEACYAKYCLHTLEGMMSSRTSEGIVPTLEEIQAYKERPPILATIELVNGALLTEDLPVAPDLNVKKVLEICAHFGGLQAARTDMMGLFVYDLGTIDEAGAAAGSGGAAADAAAAAATAAAVAAAAGTAAADGKDGGASALLPFTPSPLRNEDFMGDVFIRKARQRRDFKFVYKRKIFLHSHPWPTPDPALNRLAYLQGEDDVIRSGTLEIEDRQSVVLLSAIAMAMDIDAKAPTDAASLKREAARYIPPGWGGGGGACGASGGSAGGAAAGGGRADADPATWAAEVAKLWPDLISKERHELEILFVEQCRDRPMYGSHFFYAVKVQCVPDLLSNLPKSLLLAFNADGMHVFSVDKKELLQQYSYADIHSWRGTRRQVSLTIWDQDTDSVFELALKTQQASDMASIILDHINAIMANAGKN